jgi:hypothetical protein
VPMFFYVITGKLFKKKEARTTPPRLPAPEARQGAQT